MLKTVGYIDAGTGSFLLTAIASGAAGVWFFVRSKWSQLRGRGPVKPAKPTGTPTPTDSASTEQ